MTCHRFDMPGRNGKGWAIVCTRGRAQHRCRYCGVVADRQCDWPLRGAKDGRTCSAYVCSRCAPDCGTANGDSVNYCPPHARMHAAKPAAASMPEPEQLTLEGLK